MVTKAELREMRELTARIAKGSVSREDWSNLAALMILHQGDVVVAAIAAQDLNEFIRVSQPIYEGHAFQFDDFRRIYDRVCTAARRYSRDVVVAH
jgi:hypothetical protein